MKFEDAQKKMIAYLSSDEFKTREDAESTLKSIPILKKIIQKGFITDNSQEGLILDGQNPDTKRQYHIEERAQVTGFLKTEVAYKFVTWLNTQTDKVAQIIEEESSKEFETLFQEGDTKLVPSIPVTVSGSATAKNKIKELDPDTTLPSRLPSSVVQFQKKNVSLNKSEKVLQIATFDPKQGRNASGPNGLQSDILKGLASV